jgi:hypothetical protein
MSRRSPLPEEFAEVPFTARSARQAGMSAGRLRASDLAHPFRGVRVAAAQPDELPWRCGAYQRAMHPRHVFSHETAAELYGLPLPLYVRASNTLHVSSPAPLRAPAGVGITGHQISAAIWSSREFIYYGPLGMLFVFQLASPEFVWAQLAPRLLVDDLVAVGDAIVGGRAPLGTIADLHQIAGAAVGHRGAKTIAAAIEHVRVGSLSRPETLLRLILVRAGFPEPVLNLEVTDASGRPIAMADLCWPEYRVLVEYEGDGHRMSRGKFRSDITRGERYQDGGWFQLRASADDVFRDPNPFAGRLARRLRERGWHPAVAELRPVAGARR